MQGVKLVDKRVDNICKKNGISECEIFYSPISYWFLYIALLLIIGGSGFFLFCYLYYFNEFLVFIPFPYLLVSFLLFSKLSNSFVITEDKFIIINPNYLFKKFIVFDRTEIQKITIDKSNNFIFSFFLIPDQNYLKIDTRNNTEIYYCVGLEILSYEDIWTEKSLDCLHIALQKKDIKVVFNL